MDSSSPVSQLCLDALVHDLDGDAAHAFLLQLRFPHVNGGEGNLRIPRSLTNKPSKVIEALLDAGAILPKDKKQQAQLVNTVLGDTPPKTMRITHRAGWVGSSFLGRDWVEGLDAESLSFAPGPELETTLGLTKGDVASWRRGLREPCAASDALTFAIAVAFAGPLLDLIGETEGVIFNFHGDSSTGKSLACRTLQSVYGRAEKNDLLTYEITPRGLEEACFAHNDLALPLDEEGRNQGSQEQRMQHRRSVAFRVPSGRGAVRSKKAVESGLANLTWKLFALTSGETPLENGADLQRLAGERVRHIDIATPSRKLGGIFGRLEGNPVQRRQEAKRLAEQVESTIKDNYGVALRPYIQKLVAGRPQLSIRVTSIIKDFVTAMGADTEAWETRFAAKFGIVGAAVILAAQFGVAPWTVRDGKHAVGRMYRLARGSVASTEELEATALRKIKKAAKDAVRFPVIKEGETLKKSLLAEVWGFRRNHRKHGAIVAILPQKFAEICGSESAGAAVLDRLIGQGKAVPSGAGRRHLQIAVGGLLQGRSRWVVLKASALA